jgi:hypothetical protein
MDEYLKFYRRILIASSAALVLVGTPIQTAPTGKLTLSIGPTAAAAKDGDSDSSGRGGGDHDSDSDHDSSGSGSGG